MGRYNRYLRMYSHQDKVRTCHYDPKQFLSELIPHYPRCYELLPPCHDGCTNDPYLIIAFKRNRKTGVRSIEWIIRGYEHYALYHSTIIYYPIIPIQFAPTEPREQNDCFMRLLENGYKAITLQELCEKYNVPCIG